MSHSDYIKKVVAEYEDKFVLKTINGTRIKCFHLGGQNTHNDIKSFLISALAEMREETLKEVLAGLDVVAFEGDDENGKLLVESEIRAHYKSLSLS